MGDIPLFPASSRPIPQTDCKHAPDFARAAGAFLATPPYTEINRTRRPTARRRRTRKRTARRKITR